MARRMGRALLIHLLTFRYYEAALILRAVADFEYEFQMTAMNQRLNSDIETVFLMADPRHQAIASRLVKEIARLDGAIESFVSPAVAAQVRAKVQR